MLTIVTCIMSGTYVIAFEIVTIYDIFNNISFVFSLALLTWVLLYPILCALPESCSFFAGLAPWCWMRLGLYIQKVFRNYNNVFFLNCREKIYGELHIARAGMRIAIQRRKCFSWWYFEHKNRMEWMRSSISTVTMQRFRRYKLLLLIVQSEF